jgi:hypothetical protein
MRIQIIVKHSAICLVTLLVASACSIQKRHYQKGYHIEYKNKKPGAVNTNRYEEDLSPGSASQSSIQKTMLCMNTTSMPLSGATEKLPGKKTGSLAGKSKGLLTGLEPVTKFVMQNLPWKIRVFKELKKIPDPDTKPKITMRTFLIFALVVIALAFICFFILLAKGYLTIM